MTQRILEFPKIKTLFLRNSRIFLGILDFSLGILEFFFSSLPSWISPARFSCVARERGKKGVNPFKSPPPFFLGILDYLWWDHMVESGDETMGILEFLVIASVASLRSQWRNFRLNFERDCFASLAMTAILEFSVIRSPSQAGGWHSTPCLAMKF